MPGFSTDLIFHGESGRLVDQQSHAVSQSMAEAAAVTGFGDNAAGDGIDVVAHRAGPDGVDGLGLGLEHNFVYCGEFGGDFTCHNHSRQVAAIKALAGPPIDQDEVAFLDSIVARHGMTQRRPRTNGDDRWKRRRTWPRTNDIDIPNRRRFVFRSFPGGATPGLRQRPFPPALWKGESRRFRLYL